MIVDSEVFKLQEPRVAALGSGRMPVEQFVNTIRPGDWLIMYKNTVYALTIDEYYAAQRLNFTTVLTKEQFQEALQRTDYNEKDMKQVQFIKTHKSNCSKCQYNAYKNRLLKILYNYPNIVAELGLHEEQFDVPEYPKTRGTIKTKVSYVFPKFFLDETYTRRPCLDCVEKHLSQAFERLGQASVKGKEALQGYPEHIPLAVIDMQEAFQECPDDCPQLKEFIMFCIGKTKRDNKVFMPIRNLMYLIELSRDKTTTTEALDQNMPDESFDLDLTDNMIEKLASLPVVVKASILAQIKNLLKVEYKEPYPEQKAAFQGLMANIADELSDYCPEVSNVLRNRRLLFRVTPELIKDTEFDCRDVEKALTQPAKVQEKVVSSEGTADKA